VTEIVSHLTDDDVQVSTDIVADSARVRHVSGMISPTVPIDLARHSEMIWPTIPVILRQIFIEREDRYETALAISSSPPRSGRAERTSSI
jgi:hypothetical protein